MNSAFSLFVKKTLFGFAAALAIVLVMETISFGVIYFMAQKAENAHLRAAISRFHPIFSPDPNSLGNPVPPTQRNDSSNPFIFDPRLGYSNKPGAIYQEKLKISEDGFICNERCENLPRKKPEKEYRIFILGGSSVAGSGVETGDLTISGQLEDLINRNNVIKNKRVRVINAGIGGAFSGQQASLLLNKVSHYEPDVVVFFDGYNDFGQWYYSSYYPYIDRYRRFLRPNLHSYDYSLITGIERMQSLQGSILHTGNMVLQYFPVLFYTGLLAKQVRIILADDTIVKGGQSDLKSKPIDPSVKQKITRIDRNSTTNYIQNLVMAAGIANSIGAKYLACLQPTLPFKRLDGSYRKQKLVGPEIKFADSAGRDKYITAYFNAAQNRFEKLSNKNTDAAVFCNLTNVFSDTSEQVYVDEIHYNRLGNKIITENILKQLMPLLGN